MQKFHKDLIHRTELLKLEETHLKDQLNNYRSLNSNVIDLTETYRSACSEAIEPSTAVEISELKQKITELNTQNTHLEDKIQKSTSNLSEMKRVALSLDQQNRALQDRMLQLAQTTENKQAMLTKVRDNLSIKKKELAKTKEKLAECELLTQSLADERERAEQVYIDRIEMQINELSHFYQQLCKDGERLEQTLGTFKNN